MKRHCSLCWILLVFVLSGCSSYKLGSYHNPGYHTIFIENFKSAVDEPALENLVTTTVIQQFQNDGTLVVTTADKADVILSGKITKFEMSPVRYSRANEVTPTEASLTMNVTFVVTRRDNEKLVIKGVAEGSTSFFIGSDLQSDKRQGVPLAAAKLGKNMVSLLVDGW